MLAMILACFIVFIVGIFGGMIGVGGVLLIPALMEILGMDAHRATATVFASFVFSGIFSAWLYARRGQFIRGVTVPLCLGGILFSYVGAQLKAQLSGPVIIMILSAMIIFAGVTVLKPPRQGLFQISSAPQHTQRLFLFCLGCVVGLLGGLAGSGGAVLIVPIMVTCGFPVLSTVSASLLFSVPSGISGSIANALHGYIDYQTLLWLAFLQLFGNYIGVALSGKTPVHRLKNCIAVVCIGTGVFLLARNS